MKEILAELILESKHVGNAGCNSQIVYNFK